MQQDQPEDRRADAWAVYYMQYWSHKMVPRSAQLATIIAAGSATQPNDVASCDRHQDAAS